MLSGLVFFYFFYFVFILFWKIFNWNCARSWQEFYQFSSFAQLCAAYQASLSITISWSLLKLMSIKLVMPSNHFILGRPLLLLPSVFPCIRVFSNELALGIRWADFWSFSFSVRPSNEYSGLISFMIEWFDLLAVQGTLKSLLQHHTILMQHRHNIQLDWWIRGWENLDF